MALSAEMQKRAIELYKISADISLDDVALNHALTYDADIDNVRSWIPELKKWLVLCSVNPEFEYTVFGNVDKLWHTFITFTHEYMAFCDRIAGHYIHHVPAKIEIGLYKDMANRLPVSKQFRQEGLDGYRELLKDLTVFGPLRQTQFDYVWPTVEDGLVIFKHQRCSNGGCTHGCGCCRRCDQ